MKSISRPIAVLLLAADVASALNDLGPLAEARAVWPDAFVPGKVTAVDFAGETFYAFAGEAESFFSGEFAESDAELYEEATLDAKARLYGTLSEGDKSRSVALSGLRIAYRWADGPMRRVVCIVPRQNVNVSPSVSIPSQSASVPESAGDTPTSRLPHSGQVSARNLVDGVPDATNPVIDTATVPIPVDKSDRLSSSGEIPIEARIRVCRDRLAETPDDPFLRLRLARLFAESGQSSRAARHYCALVKRLAADRSAMSVHDAAAAMVEAAEHARATDNDAQALKFYRSAWKLNDPELQPRITAAISFLRLHID